MHKVAQRSFNSPITPLLKNPSPSVTKAPIFQLCDTVRETAFALHSFLRYGHAEKVYENGMVHRLNKQGVHLEQQSSLQVRDEDGTVLGDFVADPSSLRTSSSSNSRP